MTVRPVGSPNFQRERRISLTVDLPLGTSHGQCGVWCRATDKTGASLRRGVRRPRLESRCTVVAPRSLKLARRGRQALLRCSQPRNISVNFERSRTDPSMNTAPSFNRGGARTSKMTGVSPLPSSLGTRAPDSPPEEDGFEPSVPPWWRPRPAADDRGLARRPVLGNSRKSLSIERDR
jgi:hypothetical protein